MKKVGFLALALALVLLLALSAGAQEELHPHTAQGHCACGGAAEGVGDHVCEALTQWTGISGAISFGELDSGNYYLTGDATVANTSAAKGVGGVTQVDGTDCYESSSEKQIVLCLNGYDLTLANRLNIYLNSSLSVCDCSWDGSTFGGTVTGGTSTYGSIAYLYAKSTMNIYGGNWTMKADTTNTRGGLFAVAQDCGDVTSCKTQNSQKSVLNLYNGNIYGGSSKKGGNISVMHRSQFNMYGGSVSDGTATSANGNLNVDSAASIKIYGGSVTGGSPEVAMALKQDHSLAGSYDTVCEAAAQGDYVRLMNDVSETATLSGDLYIDLAGCDLSGLTVTGTVYGMDSTTDAYDGSQAGTMNCTGNVAAYHKNQVTGAIKSYLTVEEAEGCSFHRYYLGITALTLKPDSVGVGYKATVAGDEAVKASLSQYGYRLSLEGGKTVARTLDASNFDGKQTITVRVDNFLKTTNQEQVNKDRAEMCLSATVVFQLKDGTQIESSTVSYSFRQITEAANENFANYTYVQKAALQTLSADYSQVMIPWDISQLHHVTGGVWASKNQEGFLNLLTQSDSYYQITAGTYVLTEDVDLGTKRLKVAAGDTVTICLNGHTITSSRRILYNYGTLNICDCHKDGEEGSLIGTQGETESSEIYAPVLYAYNSSVTNLYGGTLEATNKATTAGVVAISHDGEAGTEEEPAAVFNMYGGLITGGQATREGGLVALWNGGTMNLYDGRLSGGVTDKNGGAICVKAGCTLNMYGGTIENGQAPEGTGGNVMVYSGGTMNLYGGTITGGSAGTGSGIYVNGQLSVAGAPQVTGNTDSNVYLPYGVQIYKADLTEQAEVGITAHTQMLVAEHAASALGFVDDEAQGTFQLCNEALFLSGETLPAYTGTTGFTAGFGRRDISPTEDMMGLPLSGFGNDTARACTEVVDPLYATVIAVTDPQGETVLLATFDLQAPRSTIRTLLLENISAATGVPEENIYLSATHTHSAPSVSYSTQEMNVYKSWVVEQFTLAALDAMADRQTATMYTGSFETSGLNFTRHYTYQDSSGVWQYFGDNFGTATYDSTTKHVTENDPTMHMLKFDRDGKDILMVNWRAHPTMTGGSGSTIVSSDFIGPLRETMEEDTDMHFAYFQGAAGNQNAWSRISSENQTFNVKANYVQYGQEMARQIIENLSVLKNIGTGNIKTESYVYAAAVDHSADSRLEDAQYVSSTYWTLSTATERSALLQEYGFSSVYHAGAVVTKYNMGQSMNMCLGAFSIGDQVAFYTAPGELWNTVSVEMEEASPYETTFTLGYCNGDGAYFTYGEALTYENYESQYCRWVQPDTISDMIAYWKAALTRLKNS